MTTTCKVLRRTLTTTRISSRRLTFAATKIATRSPPPSATITSLNGSHIIPSCQCARWFSTNEAAAAKKEPSSEEAQQPKTELTFSTPRVEALYKRMIQLHPDQVAQVGDVILNMLGKPAEPDEFYYHGIGKSGGGGGKAAAAGGAEAEEEAPAKREVVDIKLVGYDDKSKIKVIKEVRAIAGLGLKEGTFISKIVGDSFPHLLVQLSLRLCIEFFSHIFIMLICLRCS